MIFSTESTAELRKYFNCLKNILPKILLSLSK